ncbi:clathrin heavy chain,putative [Plasmodium sp. gorilla clade G2]|uniref:clathrin heavy chain,putative n=1 Tax=Plasmodium sp. gorilla clade G2 TaxID=880535 RepID=UPI000D2B72A9|nr:clathrin heavy chain,putative [Plasmodium sp. gorilla clade G2]SOV19989.1 clathrin heavy chain,putative [Plasmodium sp. gorilla clade G2]
MNFIRNGLNNERAHVAVDTIIKHSPPAYTADTFMQVIHKNSIDEYDNFNQTNLLNKLENHKLPEMRRIAALLYKKNKKYKEAINLSKKKNNIKMLSKLQEFQKIMYILKT